MQILAANVYVFKHTLFGPSRLYLSINLPLQVDDLIVSFSLQKARYLHYSGTTDKGSPSPTPSPQRGLKSGVVLGEGLIDVSQKTRVSLYPSSHKRVVLHKGLLGTKV